MSKRNEKKKQKLEQLMFYTVTEQNARARRSKMAKMMIERENVRNTSKTQTKNWIKIFFSKSNKKNHNNEMCADFY